MRKTGPILPPQVGLKAGWLIRWSKSVFRIFNILSINLLRLLLCFISVHCCYSIIMHFSALFSSKAYSIACLKVQNFVSHYFSYQSQLLSTNILNYKGKRHFHFPFCLKFWLYHSIRPSYIHLQNRGMPVHPHTCTHTPRIDTRDRI